MAKIVLSDLGCISSGVEPTSSLGKQALLLHRLNVPPIWPRGGNTAVARFIETSKIPLSPQKNLEAKLWSLYLPLELSLEELLLRLSHFDRGPEYFPVEIIEHYAKALQLGVFSKLRFWYSAKAQDRVLVGTACNPEVHLYFLAQWNLEAYPTTTILDVKTLLRAMVARSSHERPSPFSETAEEILSECDKHDRQCAS